MKRGVLFLAFLTFPFAAFAGHGDYMGNGGTVMVCKDHTGPTTPTTMVTYDIYEGQVLRGLTPQMGPANLDYTQKVEMVLARIPEQNNQLRETLTGYWQEFQAQHIFGQFDLNPVSDTGSIVLAPGCELRQAAIQREPMADTEKRYYVDQKIWNQLDNDSKAALVLHEIVYRMTITYKQETSVGARILNSYLMDARDLASKPCLYMNVIHGIGIDLGDTVELGSLRVWASLSDLTPTCQIRSGFVVSGQIQVNGMPLIPMPSHEVAAVSGNDDGTLNRVIVSRPQPLKVGPQVYTLDVSGGQGVIYLDHGRVQQMPVKNIDVVIGGHHVTAPEGELFFDADGNVTKVASVPSHFALQFPGVLIEKAWWMEEGGGTLRVLSENPVNVASSQGVLSLVSLFIFSQDSLVQGTLENSTMLRFGDQMCLAAGNLITFYPGLRVKSFVTAQSCELTSAAGQKVQLSGGLLVTMDEAGHVASP
jgi:hypothetical protein